jgi:dihydroceramidase
MAAPMWGTIDAAHVFWEPKYATSPYFAEYYNSLSSFIYVAAAAVGALLTRGSDWRIGIGWATLAVVGMGSAAFHATMRFTMELCDEIPMLLLALAFLVGKEDCIGVMSGSAGRRRFRLTAFALFMASSLLYITLKIYEIFIASFTIGVLAEIAIDVACKPKTWQTRAAFWVSEA